MNGEDPGLLTDEEHALVRDVGALASRFDEVMGGGATYDADVREVLPLIHALQNHVLANAAARAYPHLYRRIGGDGQWSSRSWASLAGARPPVAPCREPDDPPRTR